eukprot:567772-Pleurochrysis_carterae.AAC.1
MSTGHEYCLPPSRISGARYHSVTTCSDSGRRESEEVLGLGEAAAANGDACRVLGWTEEKNRGLHISSLAIRQACTESTYCGQAES